MDSSGDESAPGSVASTAATVLRVITVGLKAIQCKMCRGLSNERSPLVDATGADRWGGYRPWGHYSKVRGDQGEVIGRKADGKLCLLCINVFNALGRLLRLDLNVSMVSRSHSCTSRVVCHLLQ
jgi:hypothetical protein